MPVDEKKAFIIENRLCFKCLNVGHISKNCGTTPTCDRCQRRHLTCLYYDNDRANSVRKHEEATEETTENCSQPYTNVKSTVSFTVLSGCSTTTSTVVPVWVSSLSQPQIEVLVYALLDTQSDSTFVTQETSDRLHADTQPVRLKLTTMTARDSVINCQRVTGLRVRGFASDASILLPPAYTRDFIPVEEAHIPTNETAKQWKTFGGYRRRNPSDTGLRGRPLDRVQLLAGAGSTTHHHRKGPGALCPKDRLGLEYSGMLYSTLP